MFTGLVETRATVRSLRRSGPEAVLGLDVALSELELGESISVSGVCLTVTRFDKRGFEADVSAETLACTTLGDLTVGAEVNIERSLRVGDRLGGHIVAGHVDGVGRISGLSRIQDASCITVSVPKPMRAYIAAKGSVAIDGVSLTVNRVHDNDDFEIMLVPHTLAVTTLSALRVNTRVNVEVDLLARYVARRFEVFEKMGADDPENRNVQVMDKLREGGFV